MKKSISSRFKNFASPGFIHENLAIFGSYLVILLLVPLDVMTGSEVSFHVLYLFPLTFIALHSSRNSVVIVAAALSISLQFIVLFTFNETAFIVKSTLFLMVTLSDSLFTLIARYFRITILEAERLSIIDPLTQLYNRRAIINTIDAEIVRQRRYGSQFSVALIDLDGFKGLNDTKGHEAGDKALVLLATILRDQTRQSDTVSRVGGDEFVILMPNTNANNCDTLCHALCKSIGMNMAEVFAFPVTASIGYTTVEHPTLTSEEILKIADRAMYQAKSLGKSGVVRGYAPAGVCNMQHDQSMAAAMSNLI